VEAGRISGSQGREIKVCELFKALPIAVIASGCTGYIVRCESCQNDEHERPHRSYIRNVFKNV
jgi:hypothetical protein